MDGARAAFFQQLNDGLGYVSCIRDLDRGSLCMRPFAHVHGIQSIMNEFKWGPNQQDGKGQLELVDSCVS